MPELSRQARKRILKNPVSALQELVPQAAASRIEELRKLHEACEALRGQHGELQDMTQQLSRRIGTAKREGRAVDDLLSDMQARSAALKSLSAQLQEMEATVLGFFPGSESPAKPDIAHGKPVRYPAATAPAVEIVPLSEDIDAWNAYVSGHPAATVYHRAEWRTLIRETFSHDCHYFMARDAGGQVAGVLPIVHLDSRLFGNFMISMPYFNYGGALANHPDVELALMTTANKFAENAGICHIEYRDTVQRAGYTATSRKVCMLLQLPESHEELWNSFSSKLRAQIRRPGREQPEVLSGGLEYLDDFYSVFSRNMRDLGTPVYGKAFFRNILQTFEQDCTLVCIRLRGRPVAAAFLIGHGEQLEIPWASTVRSVNHLSMNMLLYWEVLKLGIDRRYRIFDFGRSSRDSGTFRFKQQWGARPIPLYWHYWLRDGGTPPALNPDNPKYALAIGIWKRLPLFAANLIGPAVVKFLP